MILALAGALAVPALQPALESARMESAARRAAAFLDDARRRAVLERAALTVRCRPEERRLVLAAAGGERAFELPPEVASLACVPEQVRYLPQGSATGMTLALRDRAGRARRLTVGPFTGLARVEPDDRAAGPAD